MVVRRGGAHWMPVHGAPRGCGGYFGVNAGESLALFPVPGRDGARGEVRASEDQRPDSHGAGGGRLAGLPEEAGMISIRRTADSISIGADYDEHVEMPMYVKAIHYRPRAVGPL